MPTLSRRALAWCLLSLAAVVSGCGDSTGSGKAKVSLSLTDAPDPLLEAAVVQIGKVELIPAAGSAVTLTESAGTYDLLKLQNGSTKSLGTFTVPAGRYLQLRMVIKSASATLKSLYTFSDGSRTSEVVVPSGAQTGLKINLSSEASQQAGIELMGGEESLVLDFDVSQSFVVQGSLGVITGYLLKPALRAVVADEAGRIQGKVSGTSSGGRMVRAVRIDGGATEEFQTNAATAVTDNDGNYTIRFLAPGTYSVAVDGVVTTPAVRATTVARAESVSGINFTLQ